MTNASAGFKKVSFEFAQHDPVAYYGLNFSERYWIELLYSDMEHILDGNFENDEQHLRSASFTAEELLSYIKNRYVSKRLILKVSPVQLRRYIRERLPSTGYVDIEPPKFFERFRRKLAG